MGSERPVLIIESNEAIRSQLVQLLGSDGFCSQATESGPQAIDWLRARSVDPCAILLEGELHEQKGRAFLECLEKEFPELFSSLPVIFSSKWKRARTRPDAAGCP